MIVHNLKIKNFRCFKEFEIEFGNRITVIFGKNGAGKTTLIHALHKALSFIMFSDKTYSSSIVDGKRKRKLVEVKSITNNNPYLKVEGFRRVGDNNNHNDTNISIDSEASLNENVKLDWSMNALTTNNRIRYSEFVDAFRKFYSWHKDTGSLPVLAYFSDSFPHIEDSKKNSNVKKIENQRNFGYFDWNAIEGCSKLWITRLETDIFNIRQGKDKIAKLRSINKDSEDNSFALIDTTMNNISRWQAEVDAIEECLIKFTQNLLEFDDNFIEVAAIDIHSEEGNLCINTNKGEEIAFINLPSGFKRLLNIVLDLAFRSYILSNNSSTDIPGVAIIDEIDLHLHPELENVVLNRLLSLFPRIQFIVSTHSINVLTSINTSDGKGKVLMMYPDTKSPQEFKDVFGIDANSGQQEIMGVKTNGEELKRLIAQCAYMYANDLSIQADNLKDFIISKKLISTEELEIRIKNGIEELKS